MGEHRGTAIWQVLSFVEDWELRPLVTGRVENPSRQVALVDQLLNAIKLPLLWIHKSCRNEGDVITKYNESYYQAAWDIVELAKRCYGFSGPFEYWHRNELGLRLDSSTIISEIDLQNVSKYEAYNRILDCKVQLESQPASRDSIYKVASRVNVKLERFTINPNPKEVGEIVSDLEAVFARCFTLPEQWQFSRYSIRQFQMVYLVMVSICMIQKYARLVAANRGCVGAGINDAVIVTRKADLIARVSRYTGLRAITVQAILDDLTYGYRQERPDPALQPLIPLFKDKYAVAPFLWINTNPERNMCVLLNRLPEEREIYLRLTRQKEEKMRGALESVVNSKGWRTLHGEMPGRADLGDIDLVIISDSEEVCLLLEFKWFIAPAEVREIYDRRKELMKGIAQIQRRVEVVGNSCQSSRCFLSIKPKVIYGAVVSKNWIGDSMVEREAWPVISLDHLISKIHSSSDLLSTIDWLRERKHLPIQGEHFIVERSQVIIDKWNTEWYGVRALKVGDYVGV